MLICGTHVCCYISLLNTHNTSTSFYSPLSLIFLPVVDLRSKLRPVLKRVLSSSRGLVRGRPLAGLKSKGEEEHE